VSAEYRDKFGVTSNQIDIAGRDFFKDKGGQIYPLADDEIKRWQKAMEPLFETYMKDMQAKGYKKSEMDEQLKYIRERIAYWTEQEKIQKLPTAH
jgi:hypothetical protein